MKIVSVNIIRLRPEVTGNDRPIICRVNTDTSIYGLGEAGVCIASGATAAFELIKDYANSIIGMNPLDHELIWEKLLE